MGHRAGERPGLRRTRGTFRRERDGAWQVVNFQRSQWSVKALNLNAFVAVAKEFGDRGQVKVAERELSRWHRDDR